MEKTATLNLISLDPEWEKVKKQNKKARENKRSNLFNNNLFDNNFQRQELLVHTSQSQAGNYGIWPLRHSFYLGSR